MIERNIGGKDTAAILQIPLREDEIYEAYMAFAERLRANEAVKQYTEYINRHGLGECFINDTARERILGRAAENYCKNCRKAEPAQDAIWQEAIDSIYRKEFAAKAGTVIQDYLYSNGSGKTLDLVDEVLPKKADVWGRSPGLEKAVGSMREKIGTCDAKEACTLYENIETLVQDDEMFAAIYEICRLTGKTGW